MSNVKIIVVYHSGYGHTEKLAEKVLEGVKEVTSDARLINVSKIQEQDWNELDAANGIIFGAPTYMGGVSGPFKTFLDATAGRWMKSKWKDKVAAGFTNSGSASGDKLNSLVQIAITAAQHCMIWVGCDVMTQQHKGAEVAGATELNRLGSYLGLMAQSNNDSPEVTPPSGDLETAKLFGKRVASITKKIHG